MLSGGGEVAALGGLRAGAAVTAYVHPRDPARAFLRRDVCLAPYVAVVVLAVIAVFLYRSMFVVAAREARLR